MEIPCSTIEKWNLIITDLVRGSYLEKVSLILNAQKVLFIFLVNEVSS